jgi:hypothetical protein
MTIQELIDTAKELNISLDTPLVCFNGETQSYDIVEEVWGGRYIENQGMGMVTVDQLGEEEKSLGYTEEDLFSKNESILVAVVGS